MDFTKLAPPGGPPSRRASYRDRPGSTRSINRSPSMKQAAGSSKVIERNNSVRKSIKKPSPSQSISSTTGLLGTSSGVSRSNSQRIKNSHPTDLNTASFTRSNTTKEDFRGRAASFKTRKLPTVLVQLTDEKNNSSSFLLLGPNAESNTKTRYIMIWYLSLYLFIYILVNLGTQMSLKFSCLLAALQMEETSCLWCIPQQQLIHIEIMLKF